jgi:predicted nucleic acid-binding protein
VTVVDASVACKWFVAEANSEAAEALIGGGQLLLAPDLILPEVCSVAWSKLRRGEIATEQATEMVEGLPNLLDELVPSIQLAGRALDIANVLGHPTYDCFYLALAELRGTQLVTDDRRLAARLVATPWSRLVVRLGEGRAES